ncbi:hypothetical protein CYMTET_8555 [Cymbomonas tetramitiformis]|uniref:Uncharacterized protein n=1 Tax=Cymbomonas tetramitiformis TaxID=36881 RepID=A0AAE0GST2_9CHLO|nr:hypothetical protein CYMTET_8555 [Cymbomonas tetramitiformis]
MQKEFLLLASSAEAYELRHRVERALSRLGLPRNVKKGQRALVQVIGHLGLEADLKEGELRVTSTLKKIHSKATELLLPAARLHLCELYCVLANTQSWGAKVPRYYAQWWDLYCEGVDALAYGLRGEVFWVKPLWSQLDEVAQKLREKGARGTVVALYWPGQSWFQEVEAIADEVVTLPRQRDLFASRRLGESELLGPSSWGVVMFHISKFQ